MTRKKFLQTITAATVVSKVTVNGPLALPQQPKEVPIKGLKPFRVGFGRPTETEVRKLAVDMQANGQINPILIHRNLIVVDGSYRIEAARMLGWTHIKARVVQI